MGIDHTGSLWKPSQWLTGDEFMILSCYLLRSPGKKKPKSHSETLEELQSIHRHFRYLSNTYTTAIMRMKTELLALRTERSCVTGTKPTTPESSNPASGDTDTESYYHSLSSDTSSGLLSLELPSLELPTLTKLSSCLPDWTAFIILCYQAGNVLVNDVIMTISSHGYVVSELSLIFEIVNVYNCVSRVGISSITYNCYPRMDNLWPFVGFSVAL